MTYFLGVFIGGGVVQMDIWSRMFDEKFHIIFKVCMCMDKRGEGGSDKCGQPWAGGEGGQKSLKM